MKRKFSMFLIATMIMPTITPTLTTLYATEIATQSEKAQLQGKVTIEKDGVDYPVEGATVEVYTMGSTPVLSIKTDKEGNYTLSLEKYQDYNFKVNYTDPSNNREYIYDSMGNGTNINYLTEDQIQLQEINFVQYQTESKMMNGTIQAVTNSGEPVILQDITMQLFEGPNQEHLKFKTTKTVTDNYNLRLYSKRAYWVALYGSDAEGNGYSYEGFLEDPETVKEAPTIILKPCPIIYLEANTMEEPNAPLIKIYVNRDGKKCYMGTPPEKGGEIVYLLGNDDDKIDLYFEYNGKEVKPVTNPVANMTIKQYKDKINNKTDDYLNFEYFEFKLD